MAFFEGAGFEDVIRTTVSLGGDFDTLTCILVCIAKVFYGIPEEIKTEYLYRIDSDLLNVVSRFYVEVYKFLL